MSTPVLLLVLLLETMLERMPVLRLALALWPLENSQPCWSLHQGCWN